MWRSRRGRASVSGALPEAPRSVLPSTRFGYGRPHLDLFSPAPVSALAALAWSRTQPGPTGPPCVFLRRRPATGGRTLSASRAAVQVVRMFTCCSFRSSAPSSQIFTIREAHMKLIVSMPVESRYTFSHAHPESRFHAHHAARFLALGACSNSPQSESRAARRVLQLRHTLLLGDVDKVFHSAAGKQGQQPGHDLRDSRMEAPAPKTRIGA